MKWLFITFFGFAFNLGFAQLATCQDYRNGSFYMEYENQPRLFITRQGDTQIEQYEGSRKKVKLKVTWIDDCTYKLEEKHFKFFRKKSDLPKGTILTVSITRTTSTFYRISVDANFSSSVFESKIYRLKE